MSENRVNKLLTNNIILLKNQLNLLKSNLKINR